MIDTPTTTVPFPGNDPAAAPLLEVRDLVKYFPIIRGSVIRRQVGWVRAVDGVSFSSNAGETLGLVGESGSGKTTTGLTVMQLERATSGSIIFQGRDLVNLLTDQRRAVRRQIQMIFQDPYGSLNPRMTVSAIIEEPLLVHHLYASRVERRERVHQLLDMVGLSPMYAGRYPHEFSGGQRQRIAFARALAVEPSFIVCDEPVSALDVSIQAQIINLLQDLQERLGVAYLFISHDLKVVRQVSHRVAVMYLGKIAETASGDDLFARPLHPYSRALLSAVPLVDPDAKSKRNRIILTGDVPSLARIPSGCRFHSRCPWAKERCAVDEPELIPIDGGRAVACHYWRDIEAGSNGHAG